MTEPSDRFGTPTAIFIVISSMVGSGILTTSGYMLLDVGSAPLVLLAWLAGGMLALCGALSLAEVAAALPRSGGEYAIFDAAYGRRAAALTGWVTLLLGFAGPIAASASAAASYAVAFLGIGPGGSRLVQIVASVVIVLVGATHASGRSHGARLQGLVTITKLVLLAALAIIGVAAGAARWGAMRSASESRIGVSWLVSLVYVSYAYTGWNGAAYIAGEVRDAGRALPRAILIGTAVVVVLYAALNLAFLLGLPVEEARALAAREGRDALEPVAELAARRLFGEPWARRLSLLAGLVLLGSLSAMLMTGPRVVQAMARDRLFPTIAGRSAPGRSDPAAATIVLLVLALVLLWSGSFEFLVVFSGIGLSVFSLATVGAVFVLRHRQPELPRPFRVPLYPLPPLIYLAGTAALVVVTIASKPGPSLAALVAILAGFPLQEWAARSRAVLPQPRDAA